MTADGTTGFTDINRQHWSLRYLPPWARPYGRLSRWDRPIGTWLLLFPVLSTPLSRAFLFCRSFTNASTATTTATHTNCTVFNNFYHSDIICR